MYGSWDIERDRHNFLPFGGGGGGGGGGGTIFCHFGRFFAFGPPPPLPNNPYNQKHVDISSFYICVP